MDPIKMIQKAVNLYGNCSEDITVVITSRILFDENNADQVCFDQVDLADNFNGNAYNHVMGQAKLGGLCSVGRRVAIVEDAPPTYSLIQIIAHELAHTLGATHDGDNPFKDIADMAKSKCQPYTGHMMAPSAHGSNNGHFSDCSIEQIRAFVSKLE
uniref:Putative metalloprotease n=1 Tax=Ixodes ricinus TaxID=34613 RepID=A0A0K8RBD3_IXORI